MKTAHRIRCSRRAIFLWGVGHTEDGKIGHHQEPITKQSERLKKKQPKDVLKIQLKDARFKYRRVCYQEELGTREITGGVIQ